MKQIFWKLKNKKEENVLLSRIKFGQISIYVPIIQLLLSDSDSQMQEYLSSQEQWARFWSH